jgi:hypothetical protein
MTGASKVRKAALGFRSHSGWACAILLGGPKTGPRIIVRRRVTLCDPSIVGSKQPFHEAEHMAFPRAAAFIEKCTASSAALAHRELKDLASAAKSSGVEIVGCGLTTASGRPLPDLKAVLASHSLIHAAEGEFYRNALARACERTGIKVSRVKEREVAIWTAARLNMTDGTLKAQLAEWGKSLGPPWTADEKLATMAAWLALAT